MVARLTLSAVGVEHKSIGAEALLGNTVVTFIVSGGEKKKKKETIITMMMMIPGFFLLAFKVAKLSQPKRKSHMRWMNYRRSSTYVVVVVEQQCRRRSSVGRPLDSDTKNIREY